MFLVAVFIIPQNGQVLKKENCLCFVVLGVKFEVACGDSILAAGAGHHLARGTGYA